MKKNLDLSKHVGYSDGRNKPQLQNGEYGLGKDSDGEYQLIVSCGNCGDYSWIPIKEILTAIKK